MSKLPFPEYPVLETDRIILRRIEQADLVDLIPISYYDGIAASNVQEAADMLAKIHQDYLSGNSIHWGIIDQLSGKIVGTCGYYRGFDHLSGELGCVLLPAYYGKGFMTLALKEAMVFGKSVLQLERIFAVTHQENLKAQQLLERLDFELVESREEEHLVYDWKGG